MPAAHEKALNADWAALCRRAVAGLRDVFGDHPDSADRQPGSKRGAGGDRTLTIDTAAEDVVFAQLEALHEQYADRGFTVVGLPCNQFGGQEPGSAEEIAEFCSATYGVTFPMTEKIEVNGSGRHPLYDVLTETADEQGHTGDIRWNFEKFLVDGDGSVVARFEPGVVPDDPNLVKAVESLLA